MAKEKGKEDDAPTFGISTIKKHKMKKLLKVPKPQKPKEIKSEFGKESYEAYKLPELNFENLFHDTTKQKKKYYCPSKLKKDIQPGQVCIILRGIHSGKRVIFLKQLEKSGRPCLIGPTSLNDFPLSRVNQKFILPTKKIVDISSVDLSDVDDKLFQKVKKEKEEKQTEDTFFKEKKMEDPNLSKREEIQKKIDDQIIKITEPIEHMNEYLKNVFTIGNDDKPHEMIF